MLPQCSNHSSVAPRLDKASSRPVIDAGAAKLGCFFFDRRELSDVFIANGIPTYVSAALAPVCNHVDLI